MSETTTAAPTPPPDPDPSTAPEPSAGAAPRSARAPSPSPAPAANPANAAAAAATAANAAPAAGASRPLQHPRARAHHRAAVATISLGVALSAATLFGVLATTTYTKSPDFPTVVRADPRLDALSDLSDAETADLGRWACSEVASGSTRLEAASALAREHSVDTGVGVALVALAIQELCPENE